MVSLQIYSLGPAGTILPLKQQLRTESAALVSQGDAFRIGHETILLVCVDLRDIRSQRHDEIVGRGVEC